MGGYLDGVEFNSNGTMTVTGNTWPYNPVNPIDNTAQYFYYWPIYQTIEKEVEPKSCIGKAHVFACEHVESCQCGAIRRVMPKATPSQKKK
jgi:hypothetical protein